MTATSLSELSRKVSPEELEYIERMLFHEFDEAQRKQVQDGFNMRQEIMALEQAMESVTLLRETLEEVRSDSIEQTADNVDDVYSGRTA